jgi:hypothetical protein
MRPAICRTRDGQLGGRYFPAIPPRPDKGLSRLLQRRAVMFGIPRAKSSGGSRARGPLAGPTRRPAGARAFTDPRPGPFSHGAPSHARGGTARDYRACPAIDAIAMVVAPTAAGREQTGASSAHSGMRPGPLLGSRAARQPAPAAAVAAVPAGAAAVGTARTWRSCGARAAGAADRANVSAADASALGDAASAVAIAAAAAAAAALALVKQDVPVVHVAAVLLRAQRRRRRSSARLRPAALRSLPRAAPPGPTPFLTPPFRASGCAATPAGALPPHPTCVLPKVAATWSSRMSSTLSSSKNSHWLFDLISDT